MELRHLKYFQAVALDLNFSQAARRIRVAQPALSRQIKALEDELGCQLFVRTTTSVALTEAGKHFLARTNEILSAVERAVLSTRQLAVSARTEFNVGSDWNLPTPLTQAAQALRKRHPGVTVNFVEMPSHEHVQGVLERRLDIGFVPSLLVGRSERLRQALVVSSPLRVVLPRLHPLARDGLVPLRLFKDEVWVGLDERRFPGYRMQLRQFAKPAGFVPRIGPLATSIQGVLPMVAVGRGISLMPEMLLAATPDGVRAVETDCALFEMCAVWRPDAGPLVESFLEEIGVPRDLIDG